MFIYGAYLWNEFKKIGTSEGDHIGKIAFAITVVFGGLAIIGGVTGIIASVCNKKLCSGCVRYASIFNKYSTLHG